jgi:molybdopterin-binding protein
VVVFNRIPQSSSDQSFGTSTTIVNNSNVSVDTPDGNYFVSNVTPNSVSGVSGSGNSGVSATVCGR